MIAWEFRTYGHTTPTLVSVFVRMEKYILFFCLKKGKRWMGRDFLRKTERKEKRRCGRKDAGIWRTVGWAHVPLALPL